MGFIRVLLTTILSCVIYISSAQEQKIVIEFDAADSNSTNFFIGISEYDEFDFIPVKVRPLERKGDILRFSLNAKKPVIVFGGSSNLPLLDLETFLLRPGDSIRVSNSNNEVIFTGRGQEQFRLLPQLNSSESHHQLAQLMTDRIEIQTVEDYKQYFEGFRKYLVTKLAFLQTRQKQILSEQYYYLRDYYLNQARFYTSQAFTNLIDKAGSADLEFSKLQNVYDSTLGLFDPSLYNTPEQFDYAPFGLGLWSYTVCAALRAKGFETIGDNLQRRIDRYNYSKASFRGFSQTRLLTRIIMRDLLRKHLTREVASTVTDFLSVTKFPRYKAYIKDIYLQQTRREKTTDAPDFVLTDLEGDTVSMAQLTGKVMVLDFWYTGCKGCIQMADALKRVEDRFQKDTNIVFLSISIDRNKNIWTKSVVEGKYTTQRATQLYTGGKGKDHAIISAYNVNSFPAIYLIDSNSKLIKSCPDPRENDGYNLSQVIRKSLPTKYDDGPYVTYSDSLLVIRRIKHGSDIEVLNEYVAHRNILSKEIQVYTPEPIQSRFTVKLKDKLLTPPSEYTTVNKVFVLSDIEGEYDALKQLLVSNRIIDSNYQWTFEDGHLVCVGDFVDRGTNVTECLWLIYMLEEKAREQGGAVHFILGNHEIMNLTGQVSYVHQKYKNNSKILKLDYSRDLYGPTSELGRWLRTKNVLEKIGNVLYVHGGISKELNDLKLPLEVINNAVRKFFTGSVINNKNLVDSIILSDKLSPFWYRGYYTDAANVTEINRSLTWFEVEKIVTGHTVVSTGKQISSHYEGKLINVDTKHAKGYSEGLFIEQNTYWRVTITGKRIKLDQNPAIVAGDKDEKKFYSAE